jgi:DNA (cytosine-5)-methyltransferase 1
MNELALFAGAGGGILGGHLLGWRTVCAVERDAYAAQVLAQRQNDGVLRPFPIWSDVCSFDGRPWRGIVDVVSGGFPCQDISSAGTGQGLEGARSGLWGEMVRIIRDVEPEWVFVENSPMLTARGLGVVLADLAALGFDAEWDVFSAADLGADHLRERIWIAAHSHKVVGPSRPWAEQQPRQPAHAAWGYANLPGDSRSRWVEMASQFRGMDDGLAHAVDRTAAIGNGQVPRVAAAAFAALAAQFDCGSGMTSAELSNP